jgi:hypothetical protein
MLDEINGFLLGVTDICKDYLPLLVTIKADMSAACKLTKKGGAYKVKDNFYMYCPSYAYTFY